MKVSMKRSRFLWVFCHLFCPMDYNFLRMGTFAQGAFSAMIMVTTRKPSPTSAMDFLHVICPQIALPTLSINPCIFLFIPDRRVGAAAIHIEIAPSHTLACVHVAEVFLWWEVIIKYIFFASPEI